MTDPIAPWLANVLQTKKKKRICASFVTGLLNYSKILDRRSATFISFRKIFQGLRSYLEGVHLLFLTKCFFRVRKVGFKTPNIMKIILFEGGGMLI